VEGLARLALIRAVLSVSQRTKDTATAQCDHLSCGQTPQVQTESGYRWRLPAGDSLNRGTECSCFALCWSLCRWRTACWFWSINPYQ